MRSKYMMLMAITTLSVSSLDAKAQIVLGTAEDFAVLGASTVDNTGFSVVTGGHVGVWPTISIIGFPPGIVVPPHIIHNADAVAQQAQSDLTVAYTTAAGLTPTQVLTGTDLGGLTLTTGVYSFASSAQLTGTLTLNAEGNPDAVFVFQMGSTLTTASNSSVELINSALACNVHWQVGSSATLGTGTDFVGNIMAQASITLTTGVDLIGRALARTAAVTMDTNDITVVICDCELDTDCAGATPFCDVTTGLCVECLVDTDCDDGVFCNGVETCAEGACLAGSDPCLPGACDEVNDVCFACVNDVDCPPEAAFCDPATNECVECIDNLDCDDGDVCTLDECTANVCVYSCADVTDPTPDCGVTDITISCDELVPTYFPTFTDNCAAPLALDFITVATAGICPQEGTIEQSVTATDVCGNATTCTRTVTVDDAAAPVITCPANVSVECDQSTDPANTGTASAIDNCDSAPVVGFTDDLSGLAGCNGTGAIVRTWTAADACGNASSCDQIITVVDDTDPVITCPEDAILECGDSTVPSVLFGTATGGVMIRYNDTTETPENQAYLKVQFSQTNDNGAAFAFSDAPLTGSGLTWALIYGSGEQFGFDLVLERPTATIAIPYTNAYDNVDNTIAGRSLVGPVRWAINDYKPSAGGPAVETNEVINSLIRSVSPPNANPDIDIEIVSLNLTTVDPFTLAISGVLHSDGINHWFSPATPDSPMSNFNLNGDFYFFGTLFFDPNADVTADGDFYEGTIQIYANSPSVQLGIALATDNCDPFPVVAFTDDLSGLTGCSETGTFTRTWTATDACGGFATCDQVITVVDTTPPEIICPTGQTIDCETDEPDPIASATATDLCDMSIITPTFEDEIGPGDCDDIMRTWTAMDECGNESTCVEALSVFDETPPTVGVVAPLDACYPTCEAFQAAAETAVLDAATDNCPSPLSVSSDVSCEGCDGTADVAVVDACGNSSELEMLSATIDDDAPTATCESTQAVFEVDANCAATVEFTGTVTDVCCIEAADVSATIALSTSNAQLAFDASTDCTIVNSSPTEVSITCTAVVSDLTSCPVVVDFSIEATDCCGNSLDVPCLASAEVVDAIPPVVTLCPEPITLDSVQSIDSEVVQNWLNSFAATDNCALVDAGVDGCELLLTNNAPAGGFPAGTTTTVTFTAEDCCANTNAATSPCESTITLPVAPRVSPNQKGSVLIFSKIEVKWDASGNLIQDTFLDFTNDYADNVTVQGWFINGDTEIEEIVDNTGQVIQAHEPGWNTADCRFELTANQPHYWSAANGGDKCQPFTVLDDDGPGRLDPENPDGSRILRGYAFFHAVWFDGEAWQDIRWNHLKGDAVIVNFANGTAWEYNAWAFQNRAANVNHGEPSGGQPLLQLDGIEYDAPYASLILDFYASGSTVLSGVGESVMVDTDLTLHAVSADLRQDGCGPVLTKVEAEIWNEFETKFSGTRRCICCWDQTMLSNWVRSAQIPNHFMREALRTDKGKARLNGVESFECDYETFCGPSALMKRWNNCLDSIGGPTVAGTGIGFFDGSQDAAILGLATKFLAFSPSGNRDAAGMNLTGAGTEPAYIQYDPMFGPEELRKFRAEEGRSARESK